MRGERIRLCMEQVITVMMGDALIELKRSKEAAQALTLAMCPLARMPWPHACLRLSGQFGPPKFIFHWPEGPVFFFFFFSASYAPLFLLGIGKTRKATLIRTYFSLYIGLMYKKVQLQA